MCIYLYALIRSFIFSVNKILDLKNLYNWAAPCEKVPSNMRKMCILISSCACDKFYPGLCSPLTFSIVSNDYGSGQRRPWSDCAPAQSDLGHCCLRMPRRHIFASCGSYNNASVQLHVFVTTGPTIGEKQ